mmetsp:Transcript_5990/g.25055  ORF Transcript_5990/g.25055 Transcript_5990/m.25055 type:complete len:210 (-) Transcript_5990:270-899(-)
MSFSLKYPQRMTFSIATWYRNGATASTALCWMRAPRTRSAPLGRRWWSDDEFPWVVVVVRDDANRTTGIGSAESSSGSPPPPSPSATRGVRREASATASQSARRTRWPRHAVLSPQMRDASGSFFSTSSTPEVVSAYFAINPRGTHVPPWPKNRTRCPRSGKWPKTASNVTSAGSAASLLAAPLTGSGSSKKRHRKPRFAAVAFSGQSM